MVSVPDIFRNITDKLQTSASIKTVYGEPVTAEGKTLIPVARVRYGFGAGGGTGPVPDQAVGATGGGGGVEITPVGIIEITSGETRYISFEGHRRIVRILVIGAVTALLLLRRRKRK